MHVIAIKALSQHVAETMYLLNVNEALVLVFVNIHVQYQKRIAFIPLHPPQNYENANTFSRNRSMTLTSIQNRCWEPSTLECWYINHTLHFNPRILICC